MLFDIRSATFSGVTVCRCFLPAARTGSMLLYKSVVGRQLDQLIRMRTTSEPRPDLTTPAVEFLKLLAVGLKPEGRTLR